MNKWETEPDVIRFTSHGLKCLIIRHSHMGHLCGYVRFPYGPMRKKPIRHNRIVGKNGYSLAEFWDIQAHGGLTFSSKPGHYLAKGKMWLGFDCAHWDDVVPHVLDTLKLIGSTIDPYVGGTYKTIEYVREETEQLAAQIVKVIEKDLK